MASSHDSFNVGPFFNLDSKLVTFTQRCCNHSTPFWARFETTLHSMRWCQAYRAGFREARILQTAALQSSSGNLLSGNRVGALKTCLPTRLLRRNVFFLCCFCHRDGHAILHYTIIQCAILYCTILCNTIQRYMSM